jgi:hypothetical protein
MAAVKLSQKIRLSLNKTLPNVQLIISFLNVFLKWTIAICISMLLNFQSSCPDTVSMTRNSIIML